MNCPEHLVFQYGRVLVWHWQHADVRREYISWAEVLNPLRYEISFGRGFAINRDAHLNRRWRNLLFRLRAKRAGAHGQVGKSRAYVRRAEQARPEQ
jgi:hypothetical protein